jgi:hypothetical protein
MSENSFTYKVVIPLFNVQIEGENRHTFQFSLPEFIPRLNYHLLGEGTPSATIKDARIILEVLPWDRQNLTYRKMLERSCALTDLPEDFDQFQHHIASAIFIAEVKEFYTDGPAGDVLHQLANSPYTDACVSAFLAALKLYDDSEPHNYRGFYFKNSGSSGLQLFWPIKEMQGPPMNIDRDSLDQIKDLFRKIWFIKSAFSDSIGHRVINLSTDYYVLSSTQTEYHIIFLFLMVAFEALFKKPDEQSVSKARARFAKLIANTKTEYNEISTFMSEDPKDKGCYCLRKAIVHGFESSVHSDTFWKLKGYLRRALVSVIPLVSSSQIDRADYYNSLDQYAERRFRGLPIP